MGHKNETLVLERFRDKDRAMYRKFWNEMKHIHY